MTPLIVSSVPGLTNGPWTVREKAPNAAIWIVFDAEGLMVCSVTSRAVADKIVADHNAVPQLLTVLKEIRDEEPPQSFAYERWRHGGWTVFNIHYPSGAVGCVSNNYHDRKWRIACDPRPFEEQPTFRTRDEAALAEWLLAQREKIANAIARAEGCASS
ncbi:MAG: hypothetical protein M9944_21935 [Rhizobiaceae bacterium]|nr:hypothetical protein [Rhizobiaceae bacterium]